MNDKIMQNDIATLKEITDIFGPSGFEGKVAEYIEKKLNGICHSYVKDKMGNVIALIKTGNPDAADRTRLMLSAHMDEVGVMVTEVCDDGLLRFDTVGGINVSVLEGRKMTMANEDGNFGGLVMSKAIHHVKREDRAKAKEIEKLYIDIGAKTKEEAEKLAPIGTFGVFDSEFYLFGEKNEFVKGKAIDDRMGCVALLEVMESIYNAPPTSDLDIYFCFTVREEIGLSGAKVAANKIRPDIAIVLETTAIGDLPDAPPARRVADVGCGGVLSIADRSTIYDRELIDLALSLGKSEQIPVQVKRYVSGGNDAGSIHKSGVGVRCLALSVPTRYLHSPACVASIEDFRSVRKLTEALIRNLR